MTAESMKLSSLNTERNRIDSMVRYYENLKSLDSSFSENLDSLILEEKKTLIRVIKEIDLKQFKIEEKQKRYEKPLVSILFLLQIFGFYILILYHIKGCPLLCIQLLHLILFLLLIYF